MIGTNNTGHLMQNSEETYLGIKSIIDLLHYRRPNMKIFYTEFSGAKTEDPQRIRNNEINELSKSLADSKNIHYLDVSESFLDENKKLPKSIMPDALHPNSNGYEIWANAMEKNLVSLEAGIKLINRPTINPLESVQ